MAEVPVHANQTQELSNRLFDAIRDNNIEQVKICINEGVDLKLVAGVNVQYYHLTGACPLASACYFGHEEIMEELLKAGADPNQVSGSRWPVSAYLFPACTPNRRLTLSMIQILQSYGTDFNIRSPIGTTLVSASYRKNLYDICFDDPGDLDSVTAVKNLLDFDRSVLSDLFTDDTSLSRAITSGNIDHVNLFLAEGADVNFGDEEWLTLAAVSGSIDMVKLVLDAGAIPFLNGASLISALMEFADYPYHDMIVHIFDTCVVDLYTADELGMTALHHACEVWAIRNETIQLLLDHGSDVAAVSMSGDTALHYACEMYDCMKIRQLLAYNPPMNRKNNSNQTPLVHLLSQEFDKDSEEKKLAFRMLVTVGANITIDFERELSRLSNKYPEPYISYFQTRSPVRSLQEMSRLVIRLSVLVPVDANLCRLPIPKLLQEYLNFPEFDSIIAAFKALFIDMWKQKFVAI